MGQPSSCTLIMGTITSIYFSTGTEKAPLGVSNTYPQWIISVYRVLFCFCKVVFGGSNSKGTFTWRILSCHVNTRPGLSHPGMNFSM